MGSDFGLESRQVKIPDPRSFQRMFHFINKNLGNYGRVNEKLDAQPEGHDFPSTLPIFGGDRPAANMIPGHIFHFFRCVAFRQGQQRCS